MGVLIFDLIANAAAAAEKSTVWFNEAWFIKIIEKLWIIFPVSFLVPKIRKATWQFLLFLKKKTNEIFNTLPFMTRIAQLEANHKANEITLERYHKENQALLFDIGKTVKKTASKIRSIENDSSKATIEFDAALNAINCSNAFLNFVRLESKDEILDSNYINCIEETDREKFEIQLAAVKKAKRRNSFNIKISTGYQAFTLYHAVIEPYLYMEKEFTGCIMELTKI